MDNKDCFEKLWVVNLRNGDNKAFRKLFDTYRNDIYTYSYSLVKNSQIAEEIVQEVFLKVWLGRETLNPELSFRAFIFTITRNHTFNFLKKAVNDKKLKDAVFYQSQNLDSSLEDQIYTAEYEILRKKAIDQLPTKRKRIFQMSREEDKSYLDISKELGISVSTVKGQMNKALSSIRTFLTYNSDLTLLVSFLVFQS
ncbi:RNA polymerase sigma-70 factor [Arenibacter sp. 6A1]|uniref:RNA polymerase sigma-70 factor n=1 Tax=Arenibacter sp. 6A1 TaxID=2720391 RepID=UPI00144578F0|nr:RNA polymerase sigma-70 factor [Arenibacter sp. 6A1]NKI27584.1 RNA polymerase sigma-70 factor [Arenibacter sp. 6A1]